MAIDGDAVWVAANGLRGNAVLRVSPRSGRIIATIPLRAHLIDLTTGDGAVWTTFASASWG